MNRNSLIFKPFSVVMLFAFLFQIFYPTVSYALTSGPTQPEFGSFASAGVNDLVDPFTGDFSYNIPLMDVGGYPLTLSYQSGVGMDQEASWVGLGWNLNPGVISRTVRGIPDDFNGESIRKTINIRDNNTFGINGSIELETIGYDAGKAASLASSGGLSFNLGAGVKFNNYNGISVNFSLNSTFSGGETSKSPFNYGLGISTNDESVSFSPSISFSKKLKDYSQNNTSLVSRLGASYNTREGLQQVSLSSNVSKTLKPSKGFKYKGNQSAGAFSSSISFANPSYTPSIPVSMKNFSISLSAKLAAELVANHPGFRVGGFHSGQYVQDKVSNSNAYGVLNLEKNPNTGRELLDFNREKDIPYSKNVKNLAVTSLTYDVYNVSGEGVGGSYRIHRNDVGNVYDPSSSNTSSGVDLSGPEFGGGNAVRGGVNVSVNFSNTYSSSWNNYNPAKNRLSFKSKTVNSNYEPSYFKSAGELQILANEQHFDEYGGYEPIAIEVNGSTSLLNTRESLFTNSTRTILTLPAENRKLVQQPRAEVVQYYTAERATQLGFEAFINSYQENAFSGFQSNGNYSIGSYVPSTSSSDNVGQLPRYEVEGSVTFDSGRKRKRENHISEMAITNKDGKKYVYGIPVYNKIKKEVSFNSSARNPSYNAETSYTNSDNSSENGNGKDHFYEEVITPAYPTAYLLTAILSDDYEDVDGIEGPSDGDLGTYVKFNYSKIHNNYKWRTPYTLNQNEGSLNRGFHTLQEPMANSDDKVNYVYGEKEIWYLHSVITKTHVAEMTLGTDRFDGKDAFSENGGIGSNALRYLDQIKLYAKEDKVRQAEGGAAAIPIKTVDFQYNYELCPGSPNSTAAATASTAAKGKLTLKELTFTYANSNKGVLSPYKFNYGKIYQSNGTVAETINPAYINGATDRWGNYVGALNSEGIPIAEAPYTPQEIDVSETNPNVYSDVDKYLAAWNLTEIKLPSGGEIKVEYESDDYAFVQNKKAMSMFQIVGAGKSVYDNPGDPTKWTDKKYLSSQSDCLLLGVKLSNGISYDPSEVTLEDFLKDQEKMKLVYFKSYVNIKGQNKKEYIQGFAEIDYQASSLVVTNNRVTHLLLKFKKVKNHHPIALATWNLVKKHFPGIAFNRPDGENYGGGRLFDVLTSLWGNITSVKNIFQSIDNSLKNRDIGKHFDENRSWVRLYKPLKKKGGGARVKKIYMNDNWSSMSGNTIDDTFYGKEYNYTMEDGYGRTISSGVTAYEPMIGNEENPFRQPRYTTKEKLLGPDEDFYTEEPYGESFYPAPNVGYRRVAVKNLTKAGVKNTIGTKVHEFYTAYDFPTITKETSLIPHKYSPPKVLKLLKLAVSDYVSVTQGYVIETNDMHGKPKAILDYAESDDSMPINGVKYYYQQDSPGKLNNSVNTINKDGVIQANTLGVEYDVISDFRQSETNSVGHSQDFNLDAFVVGIFPIVLGMMWANHSREHIRYNSASITKTIHRKGILERTEYYDQNRIVNSEETILYDYHTGEGILNSVKNSYDDLVYNFKYPAHWAYERIGPAYKNYGVIVNPSTVSDYTEFFVEGDKVVATRNLSGSIQQTVCWVESVSSSSISLIDKDGGDITSPYDFLQLIDPGRRNKINAFVGSVLCRSNPLKDQDENGAPDALIFDNILAAEAMEYSEKGSIFCNCLDQTRGGTFQSSSATPHNMNPYLNGLLGNWKPYRKYAYLTNRSQSRFNDNLNIRDDGKYEEFSPFWLNSYSSGGNWVKNTSYWVSSEETTVFNPYGSALESKDALERYSSVLLGFDNKIPIAVASNSELKNMGYEGFEDIESADYCTESHMGFNYSSLLPNNISSTESHSGRNSLYLPSASSGGTSGEIKLRREIDPCN